MRDETGIDQAMEAATEALCDDIQTPEEAYALKSLLPALRISLGAQFLLGRQEGEMITRQTADFDSNNSDD
ncbi:MAG: hypothetical protein AAFR65_10460 [Pseudomonadota bacterium]